MHLPLLDHVHCLDPCDECSSTPKRFETEHWLGDSFDRSAILFDHAVEVFVLTQPDIDTGINLDTFNGRRIGATLVDGDLLWHAMQVDCALQKASGCSLISLGSQQKIDDVASSINRAVEVIPVPSLLIFMRI